MVGVPRGDMGPALLLGDWVRGDGRTDSLVVACVNTDARPREFVSITGDTSKCVCVRVCVCVLCVVCCVVLCACVRVYLER
jgi:hypothetical protein